MSDGLSAFFAKKRDKKKKGVVKMDDVGQILERRAKKQEEQDEQTTEDDKRLMNDETQRVAPSSEESEWIEYNESNQGRFEGLKIKDMGAELEHSEEIADETTEQKDNHSTTRTWGQVDKKQDNDVESAADMAAYQNQKQQQRNVFIPSVLREKARATDIDVTNQEMFPSLADASKMETAKKEDAKVGGGGWVKTGQSENRPMPSRGWGDRPTSISSGRDRESALATLREVTSSNPVTSRSAVDDIGLKKSAGAYVPPHLRNRN